jgi:hypothetical protein
MLFNDSLRMSAESVQGCTAKITPDALLNNCGD